MLAFLKALRSSKFVQTKLVLSIVLISLQSNLVKVLTTLQLVTFSVRFKVLSTKLSVNNLFLCFFLVIVFSLSNRSTSLVQRLLTTCIAFTQLCLTLFLFQYIQCKLKSLKIKCLLNACIVLSTCKISKFYIIVLYNFKVLLYIL